jgi:peptidoglycan/xylan/chitin deacetylase (PgdA/CDA1 family)
MGMKTKKKLSFGLWFTVALFLLAVVFFWASGSIDSYGGVPVLNYHGVSDHIQNPLMLHVKEFDKQIAYLHREGYHTITPQQLLAHLKTGAPLPSKPILITFDDGYRNVYENACPILKKYGMTATFFIITDFVGKNQWYKYLTWNQINEMHKEGFTIGSHTVNHLPLNTLPDKEAMTELTKSKAALERHLGVPIEYFAYPGGAYNQKVIAMLKKAGYKAAFTVHFGLAEKGENPYTLDRIPIFQKSWPFAQFYVRLMFTRLYASLKMLKTWVVGPPPRLGKSS